MAMLQICIAWPLFVSMLMYKYHCKAHKSSVCDIFLFYARHNNLAVPSYLHGHLFVVLVSIYLNNIENNSVMLWNCYVYCVCT